jgi:hypothetical protein
MSLQIDASVFGTPDPVPPEDPWSEHEPAAGDNDPDTPAGKSWQPVNLGPYLRGEHIRPEPSIGLARSDGLQLIYPGKEHTVIGEMESGKSWLLVACAAAELVAGHIVVYIHFEEADPTDTVERLIALGVGETIGKQLLFVGPDEHVTADRLAPLLETRPSLAIFDGVNEAMSLHGWGIRDEDGAATFRRRLVKPFTAAGAATLAADHVVKDKEKRGRDPLGSIHKGDGLTGTLILLENADPFGRSMRGRSHVYVTKDRPGYLRRQGRPDRKIPGKTFMGELVVDDTRTYVGHLELKLWAPNDDTDDTTVTASQRDIDESEVLAVVTGIAASGREANMRAVYAASKFGKDRTSNAVERLLLRDALIETRGAKNARLFTVPEDQLSESAEAGP